MRPAPVRPGQEARPGERRRSRGQLHAEAVLIDAEVTGRDDAERGDLRDGQVNEDDAACQHLPPQRHVRGQHQQSRHHGGSEDTDIQSVEVHFAAASSLSMVESKNENRSFDCASPPTVYGSTTTGTPVRSDSQRAGFWSW